MGIPLVFCCRKIRGLKHYVKLNLFFYAFSYKKNKSREIDAECLQATRERKYYERCGHPAQQHGLRLPAARVSQAQRTRLSRVSAFFADVTQQIYSLRASGVISSHVANAAREKPSALRKSAGVLWTVPLGMVFGGMATSYAD
jgi:hypothetical protein